jgi:hypothetical protein
MMGQEMFQIFFMDGVLEGMGYGKWEIGIGEKVQKEIRKLNESYPGSKLSE